jgi:AcrR family transcriptional regulator
MDPRPPVKPSRKKSPDRFHHGDLREQAAVEACRIVAEHGHAALSMRRVATTLGVTEPAIYRHYESREALLAEVSLRGFEPLAGKMRDELTASVDALDGVRRFCRGYVRYAAQHRGWFLLAFSREMSESPHVGKLTNERTQAIQQERLKLLDALRGMIPAGDDPADLYRLAWGTAHGLAFLVVERVFQLVQTDEERIAAADRAIDLLVASLRARAPQDGDG